MPGDEVARGTPRTSPPDRGLPRRHLGGTSVDLSTLALGCAPVGNLHTLVTDEAVHGIVRTAVEDGVSHFDTAPWYGLGLSEHRLGHHLYEFTRDQFTLSTKVGRVLTPRLSEETEDQLPWVGPLPFEPRFDYSRSGILRSYEDSLQRLGTDRVELLLIHDLDVQHHGEDGVAANLAELDRSGWAALDELRSDGTVAGVGAGVNEVGMIPRFLDRFEMDFFLVAMPYTLLDQPLLDGDLQRCEAEGTGLMIGSPYASGILATGTLGAGRYGYRRPEAAVINKVRSLEEVSRRHGVPLRAAALQFPLAHAQVASVVAGAVSSAEVSDNVAMMRFPIPPAFWAELKDEGLIRAEAATPVAPAG